MLFRSGMSLRGGANPYAYLHDVALEDVAEEWPIEVHQEPEDYIPGIGKPVKPEAPLPSDAPGFGPEPDDLPRPRAEADGRIFWDPCVDPMEKCQCEECLAFWREERSEEGYDF